MTDQQVTDFIQERLQKTQEDKRLREPELNGNIAYYMGDQWIKYNAGTGLLMAMRNTAPRHTRNVIQPIIDTITGQIMSASQHLVCRPNSNEIEDIYGAEIGTAILESEVWRGLGVRKALLKIIPLLSTAGSVVLHPYYNYKAGRKISKEEINNAFGADYWKSDKNEGKLEWDVLSPFEVSTDTSALDDEHALWWNVGKFMTTQEIKENWGKDVKPAKTNYLRISNAYQRFIDTVEERHIDRKLENSALVNRFWHKPCDDFPKGLFAVLIDDGSKVTCIYQSKLPWGLDVAGVLPFVKIDYKSILGRRWGISPVTAARPSQKRINTMLTQWQAFKRRYMFPAILNPTDSGVSKEQLVNRDGEVIDYTTSMASERGGEPHFMQVPQFNPQFFEDIEIEKEAIRESFGINSYSSGAGAAKTSGRGISLMQSASEARISPVQVSLEEGFSKLGTLSLLIIENTYTIPRLIKIAGSSRAREVQDFTGDMLHGNHNVVVEFSSYLPLNKQSAIDVVNAWWTNQIIPQTDEGREVANKMLQTESFAPYYAASRIAAQAKYENSILDKGTMGEPEPEIIQGPDPTHPGMDENGQPMEAPMVPQHTGRMMPRGIPRNEWDDDRVHLKEHEDRQREISYMRLIAQNPQVKEAYELHKNEHRQAIVQQEELALQQQAQQMQQQMQQQVGQEQLVKQHEQDMQVLKTEAEKEIIAFKTQMEGQILQLKNELEMMLDEQNIRLESALAPQRPTGGAHANL